MRPYVSLLLIVLAMAVCGCSPEAQRTRGGGPGADIGNRDAIVQLHGDVPPEQRIFYRTPRKAVGPPETGRTP
jgi:hypothetical protein